MMAPSKTELKTFMRHKLATDPKWALKALILLYERQTKSEQVIGKTTDLNNRGFSGKDAELLSSFAKQYINRGTLSGKQMSWLYRKITHYSRQVIECSDQAKLMESFQNYMNYLTGKISKEATDGKSD